MAIKTTNKVDYINDELKDKLDSLGIDISLPEEDNDDNKTEEDNKN